MRRQELDRQRLGSNPAWAIAGVLFAAAALPAILFALAKWIGRVT